MLHDAYVLLVRLVLVHTLSGITLSLLKNNVTEDSVDWPLEVIQWNGDTVRYHHPPGCSPETTLITFILSQSHHFVLFCSCPIFIHILTPVLLLLLLSFILSVYTYERAVIMGCVW